MPFFALTLLGCKKDATAPAVGTKLAFSVQPASATVDSSITPVITVSIEDATGAIVTTGNPVVTIALAANPSGALLHGVATAVSVAGLATFASLSVSRPGTGYTLVASGTNLAGDTSAPFNVTSMTTGAFASVNTGGNTTCGVTTGRVAYCWGNNDFGQLGNGGTADSPSPTSVGGGLAFGSVGVGGLFGFACGLSTAGAAYCWGYNDDGQLGDGSYLNSVTPVAVAGNLSFTSLSVGERGHACGLAIGGTAYCWGYNANGQLGVGAVPYSNAPLQVSGGLSFTSISAGANDQTCGVTNGGAAYCWGSNANGELGNGSTANSSTPVAVSGGLNFKAVSVGFASTCGITSSGVAYCWGDNTYGELGNGSATNSKTPVAVAGGMTFTAVSVGDAFACGLAGGGQAYCWGYAAQGQLGTGSVVRSSQPVAVLGGLTFASISAGYGSACAVTSGGAAYCWGDNVYGEAGNATIGGALLFPVLVATPASP